MSWFGIGLGVFVVIIIFSVAGFLINKALNGNNEPFKTIKGSNKHNYKTIARSRARHYPSNPDSHKQRDEKEMSKIRNQAKARMMARMRRK